jgi:hypothetical protein
MSNNLPLSRGFIHPQSSPTREENIKRLAQEILLNIPLHGWRYPIFIVNETSYVIVDDISELAKKKPKIYAGFMHVKDNTFEMLYDNDLISEALVDIVKVPVITTKHTIILEAYNNTMFFGDTEENIYHYQVASEYNLTSKEHALALLSYYITRFKTKYHELAEHIQVQISKKDDYYGIELHLRLATPSLKFLTLLQQILDQAQPKTRREKIEEEIRRENREIQRLKEEIKKRKAKIKALEAEKEKLSQEIPISEERIASVVKEVIKNAA